MIVEKDLMNKFPISPKEKTKSGLHDFLQFGNKTVAKRLVSQ